MANRDFLSDGEVFGGEPETLSERDVFGESFPRVTPPGVERRAEAPPVPLFPRVQRPLAEGEVEQTPRVAVDIPQFSGRGVPQAPPAPPLPPTDADLFGPVEVEAAEPSEIGGPGRLLSGVRAAAQGATDFIADIPKATSILSSAIQRNVFEAQGIDPGLAVDPRTTPEFQAGEALSGGVREALPTNPEFEGEFFADVLPRGLGSTAGFAATGLAGRAVGVPALLAASGAGAASGASRGFDDALRSGASIEDAFTTSGLNAIVGTSEGIPISRLLDRLDRGTGGSVRQVLSNAIKQGTEEAAQEVFQQISENLIASQIVSFDPNRQLFTGVAEGGAVGFTAGGLFGFIAGLVSGGRRVPSRERVEPTIGPPGALDQQAPVAAPEGVQEPLTLSEAEVFGEPPIDPTAEPPGAPAEQPAEQAPPPESRRDDLREIIEDERPLAEIQREADAIAAEDEQRLTGERETLPEAGTPVTVEAEGIDPFTGNVEEVFQTTVFGNPVTGVRVRAESGDVFEFQAGDVQLTPIEQPAPEPLELTDEVGAIPSAAPLVQPAPQEPISTAAPAAPPDADDGVRAAQAAPVPTAPVSLPPAEAEAAGAAPVDLNAVDVTFQVQVEETGETVTVTENAGKAFSDAQSRVSLLQELVECLR